MREIVRRDVHGSHDPVVADVEDRDRCVRELEVAEKRTRARERVREERTNRAAVRDDERDVPAGFAGEAFQRRDGTVEQRADRLAAEERCVFGKRAAECSGEGGFGIGEFEDASGLELAQVRPRLGLAVGGDDLSGLDRPREDVAWPLVRAWRFGADDLRLGGVGEVEPYLERYIELTGRAITVDDLFWWEVLGNAKWAIGALTQSRRHLSGQERSVELVVLGRLAAEMEYELLDLIERAA